MTKYTNSKFGVFHIEIHQQRKKKGSVQINNWKRRSGFEQVNFVVQEYKTKNAKQTINRNVNVSFSRY